jgi:hypothetical protein
MGEVVATRTGPASGKKRCDEGLGRMTEVSEFLFCRFCAFALRASFICLRKALLMLEIVECIMQLKVFGAQGQHLL